jgi:hypothetical protein
MITGLIAVVYRTAQGLKILPPDETIFPFLVLLTWVLFLYWVFGSARAVRQYRKIYNSWARERRVMAYACAIAIGAVIGGVSGGLWWKLFEAHRQQMRSLETAKETTTAPNVPEKPTKIPTTRETPPSKPPEEQHPAKAHAKPHTPALTIGPRLGIGPEAYKDLTDEQVGQWAMEESSKIEKLATDAYNSNIKTIMGQNAMLWRFTQEFNDCCAQDVKDLRTEILRRLGPEGKDPDEILAWTALFPDLKYPGVPPPAIISTGTVSRYAPFLRRLGIRLKRRAVPRNSPLALRFHVQRVDPTNTQFSCRIWVTIETKAKLTTGYVVVELIGPVASMATDFADSKLVISPEFIEDKELTKLVSTRGKNGPTVYALQIGDTPFAPDKPIHVEASGKDEIKVSAVRYFEE